MIHNDGELYFNKVIDSSSPLTTTASTPFRLAVLGLLEEEVCYKSRKTENHLLESNPYDIPIASALRQPICDLTASPLVISGNVGETHYIDVDHGENKDIFHDFEVLNGEAVRVRYTDDKMSIKLLKPFSGYVTIKALYSYCLECVFTIRVTAIKVEKEEEDEPIEEIDYKGYYFMLCNLVSKPGDFYALDLNGRRVVKDFDAEFDTLHHYFELKNLKKGTNEVTVHVKKIGEKTRYWMMHILNYKKGGIEPSVNYSHLGVRVITRLIEDPRGSDKFTLTFEVN